MRHAKNIDDNEANIDLTPMLDVVFIMLIFFIVTASFIKETTLSFDRPDPNQQTIKDQSPKNIILTVHPDNQIAIDGLFVDKRALRAYFERHHAKNPEAMVIIKAHNKSKTSALTAIADAANAAGMQGVSLTNVEDL